MTVEVEADGGENAHQAQRQLDLLAALEFTRLHAALSRKEGTSKGDEDETHLEEPSTSSGEQESEPDRKTRQAIERALKENWGLRETKRYVDKAIKQLAGQKEVGRPRAPFKWKRGWLQVNVERLDALNASEKAELRKVIEQVLTRL